MRLVFAGTPEFARVALERLHQAAGFEIVLVLTQPDRPAGRGLKLQPSAVKQFALAEALPVAQPRGLRLDGRWADDAAAARDAIEAAQADAMVVAAYGLILPAWVLAAPRLGCLNIHASLLPRWRGAAPIHRAIEAGDAETGVTIMQMDEGLDTGGMLRSQALPIEPGDTTGSLHDKLAALGADLIVQALQDAGRDALRARPQPAEGVTYAHKIDKAEAQLDWSQPAEVIARRIRAFDPAPGAQARLSGEVFKLWRAQPLPGEAEAPPGTVVAADAGGIDIACGTGRLRVTELQRAGGRRLPAAQLLRGFAIAPGMRFSAGEAA
ncbi:methionyl-tRNA formyltransferase [Ramlibacter rhizophilus]|uniref:Methionyl-tRNA formyltransferase n=1 Tax=Ramlibacter rhizophilus TaxID=1781167 RepID=A0A4Z0BEU1_9BURK|nr:methionyl-tRNA formyltransferase [Ramlibacter rhizophilus]TFY97865.1 methionyl-tRNA formyltransferase [Ramlibacter rhizophilus]